MLHFRFLNVFNVAKNKQLIIKWVFDVFSELKHDQIRFLSGWTTSGSRYEIVIEIRNADPSSPTNEHVRIRESPNGRSDYQ